MASGSSHEFYPDRQTVFVLGAGASVDYGFPTGPRLKFYAGERIKEEPLFAAFLQEGEGFTPYDVLELLIASTGDTIDECIAYLDPKYQTTARRITARAIGWAEWDFVRDKTVKWEKWYPKFFHLIGLAKKSPDVKVITFNYDRSLEFFLADYPLKNVKHGDQEEVIQRGKDLKIIRPHGSLGTLEELPFGRMESVDAVNKAADRILLIDDERAATGAFEEAHQAILEAEQVVFIGFAFHDKTFDHLLRGITNEDHPRRYFTTAVGLDEKKWHAIKSKFPNNRLSIPDSDKDRNAEQLIELLADSDGKNLC